MTVPKEDATERMAQEQAAGPQEGAAAADATQQQATAGGDAAPNTHGDDTAAHHDLADRPDSSEETDSGPTEGDGGDVGALQQRIAELEALNQELSDRYVRLAADFDNFRRRTRQNEDAVRAAATEALMTDLLPILDNFSLAIAAAGDALGSPFGQGVNLIYQQINEVLAQHGLEPVAAQGHPFDPNTMEAVATEAATDEVPDGHVLEEFRRGYKLNGKLLRPSQVKVAQAPSRSQ